MRTIHCLIWRVRKDQSVLVELHVRTRSWHPLSSPSGRIHARWLHRPSTFWSQVQRGSPARRQCLLE